MAVSRHKRNCIPRKLELAIQRGSIQQSVSFLDRIRWNIEQTILLYERNGQVDDKTALAALKEIREACKDEANGPMPTTLNLYAEIGGKENAQKAIELWKSTQAMDEEALRARSREFLSDYWQRHPENKLNDLALMAGEVGEE